MTSALSAYAGIFPPNDPFPWEQTLARWQHFAGELVVAERDAPAELVGFVAFDRSELHALYVLPEQWGHGVGARLLAAAGGVSVLWVLEGNARARRFYEQHGWEPDGVQRAHPTSAGVVELRYRRPSVRTE